MCIYYYFKYTFQKIISKDNKITTIHKTKEKQKCNYFKKYIFSNKVLHINFNIIIMNHRYFFIYFQDLPYKLFLETHVYMCKFPV